MELKYRTAVSLDKKKRPTTDKIIFLSCEGQATEEEYFAIVSVLFDGIKSKVQFISVMSEALTLPDSDRTDEQKSDLGKSQPYQLVEKIDKFKEENKDKFEFNKHPQDEFWSLPMLMTIPKAEIYNIGKICLMSARKRITVMQ